MDDIVETHREMLAEAAAHLQLVLELLDRAGAPAHIGAHVDLAAHQLHDALRQAMARSAEATNRSGQVLQ